MALAMEPGLHETAPVMYFPPARMPPRRPSGTPPRPSPLPVASSFKALAKAFLLECFRAKFREDQPRSWNQIIFGDNSDTQMPTTRLPLPHGAMVPAEHAERRRWTAVVAAGIACAALVVLARGGGEQHHSSGRGDALLQGEPSGVVRATAAATAPLPRAHAPSGRTQALVAGHAGGAALSSEPRYDTLEYGYGDPEDDAEGAGGDDEWGLSYGPEDEEEIDCSDFGSCSDALWRPPECPCEQGPAAAEGGVESGDGTGVRTAVDGQGGEAEDDAQQAIQVMERRVDADEGRLVRDVREEADEATKEAAAADKVAVEGRIAEDKAQLKRDVESEEQMEVVEQQVGADEARLQRDIKDEAAAGKPKAASEQRVDVDESQMERDVEEEERVVAAVETEFSGSPGALPTPAAVTERKGDGHERGSPMASITGVGNTGGGSYYRGNEGGGGAGGGDGGGGGVEHAHHGPSNEPGEGPAGVSRQPEPASMDSAEAGAEAAQKVLTPVLDVLKKEEQDLMTANDLETLGVVREMQIDLEKVRKEFSNEEARKLDAKLAQELPALQSKNATAAVKIVNDTIESLILAEKVNEGVRAFLKNHSQQTAEAGSESTVVGWQQQTGSDRYDQRVGMIGGASFGSPNQTPPDWYKYPPAWYFQNPWKFHGSPPASPARALPQGQPSHGWLPYPYGTPPGLPADVVALVSPPEDEDKWLDGETGRMWLDTPNGLAWLRTGAGQSWIISSNGQQWLWSPWGGRWLSTPDGWAWAARNPQMAAQFAPPHDWGQAGGITPVHPQGSNERATEGNGWARSQWNSEGQAYRPLWQGGEGGSGADGRSGTVYWQGRGMSTNPGSIQQRGFSWQDRDIAPNEYARILPEVQKSKEEVTETLDAMLKQAREAERAYNRVEDTMENLRSAVSMIKDFMTEVKPLARPEGSAIWGNNQQQVEYTAQQSDPDSEGALSSLWLKNAIRNTAAKLGGIKVDAGKVSAVGPVEGTGRKAPEKTKGLVEGAVDGVVRTVGRFFKH